MQHQKHGVGGYVLAAVAGAVGGGLVVALSTHAVREMMTEMRSMRDECCKMMGHAEHTEGVNGASCEECAPQLRSA